MSLIGRWEAGVTPASSFSVPASGALVYLAAVYTFKNFRPGEEIRSKSFEVCCMRAFRPHEKLVKGQHPRILQVFSHGGDSEL